MLAQSFWTPAELEITEVGFNALVTVLGMLDRGEIAAEEFDMSDWWGQRHDDRGRFMCGSVGCIGGWAIYAAREAGHRVVFGNHGTTIDLYELFHPEPRAAWKASREQAAQALRNYLTTGRSRWEEVMSC